MDVVEYDITPPDTGSEAILFKWAKNYLGPIVCHKLRERKGNYIYSLHQVPTSKDAIISAAMDLWEKRNSLEREAR